MPQGPANTRKLVAERHETEQQRFLEFCESAAWLVLAERDKAEWDPSRPTLHADYFAHARSMSDDRKTFGSVRPETWEYARLQNGSGTLESIGQPFIATFEIELGDDGELYDQRGKSEMVARRRAFLGAMALEAVNPGMEFYTERTKYEFLAKLDEQRMMREAPVGTVIGLVSPADTGPYARRLGFQPDRNLAMLQFARKSDDRKLQITNISLDNAEPDLLRPILAEYGTELPADIKTGDFLAYRFNTFAATHQELLESHVRPTINRFDQRLRIKNKDGRLTRQGQDAALSGDVADLFWRECDTANQTKVIFDELLSHTVEAHPKTLPVGLKIFAQQALHFQRENGLALLGDDEQALVRNLLAASGVTIENKTHAAALELLKDVMDTMVDKAVRQYLKGDTAPLLALRNLFSEDLSENTADSLMQVAADAADAGEYSSKCGNDSSFGQQGPQGPGGGENGEKVGPQWCTCPFCDEMVYVDPCAKLLECYMCEALVINGQVVSYGNAYGQTANQSHMVVPESPEVQEHGEKRRAQKLNSNYKVEKRMQIGGTETIIVDENGVTIARGKQAELMLV